jgi:PAS domain S-box-containing protein
MDKKPLRLLLAEDNPDDADLILRRLRSAGFDLEHERVETEPDYLSKLSPDLDIILSDFSMPQFTGLRALQLLKESELDLPFILISGTIGEETAVAAMRRGATDYLLKDRLTRLGEAVRQALEQHSVRKERERAEEAMRQSENKYRHLFESLTEAAFLIEATSRRVLDANLSAEKLLGLTRSEILGLNESMLFPPDKAANYSAKLAIGGADRPNELDEVEIQSKSGRRVIVRASMSPIQFYGRDLLLVLMADITDRKRTEQKLGALEQKHALILNSAGEGIYGTDLDGKINFANPKAAEVLGWKVEELLGKSARDTIHHARADGSKYSAANDPIADCLQGATKRITNEVMWRKAGKSFRAEYVCAPVKDETGQITGAIVTFQDVTEQFMAEARLKLQEQKYRLLFEINPSPMWVFEAKTLQILAVNDAAIAQYGYSREEFLKLSVKELRLAEDIPELLKARALSSPQNMSHYSGQFRHKRKDGSLIFVEIYSAPLIWENVQARIVTGIDITERKQAEERLREQAEIISRAHDAIIIRDFHTDRITFWNEGAERMYGWTAAEAVSQNIADLLYSASIEDREQGLKILIETGEFNGEIKQQTKDGRELITEVRATLIRNEDGTPRAVLAINSDITEKKRLESQLLRAQRLESIGTLASGVAHDLNNVLTPILMASELVHRQPTPEKIGESMQLIEESARRGAAIVKQVLTFARGVEGQRVVIKPSHLIDEMADIARKTFPKSIEITTRYPEELWSIEADPTQLHQVLLNLSINARDAMPDGGTLILAAENLEIDKNYAAMMPGASVGPHVVLRVSDTGSGMPRDVVEKIFDPFFTTKELGKGTGLGLSTALGIVKSHKGIISVYSEPSQGTTFKILLPAAKEISETDGATRPVEMSPGHGELVLVVDDEANILRVTPLILEEQNYRVVCASEAAEALAILAQRMTDVQIVLTDMILPHMDGISLIRTMRKMKPELKFIASTGQGYQARKGELESLGVNHFLPKPYDSQKLLETLHKVLTEV